MNLKTLLETSVGQKKKLMVSDFTCKFCNKSFVKEKTFTVHMCEKKRRFIQKDERRVQSGFMVFKKFYQVNQKNSKEKTYEDFLNSSYYNAFVKFGSFLSNVNPLYPDNYIDWIVKSGISIDKWCREEHYDKYVVNLIKTEPVEIAAERSVKTMIEWAEKTNAQWNHYFYYVNIEKLLYDIRDGKISPWILLNSTNGVNSLKKMTDNQLDIITPMIDPVFWNMRFTNKNQDLEFIKHIIKEANI
jgi:hypothetical protein